MPGRNGDTAFLLGGVNLDLGPEGQLGIGCGHLEDVAFEVKKEVLQDREGGLGRDGLGDIHKPLEQLYAGNVEFHIVMFFDFGYGLGRLARDQSQI